MTWTEPTPIVLRKNHGQTRVVRWVLALSAAIFALLALVAFTAETEPGDASWLPLVLVGLVALQLAALSVVWRRRYVIVDGQVTEATSLPIRAATSVLMSDVVMIGWHSSVLRNRAPQGCVLWADSGGHVGGFGKWAATQVEPKSVRLERERIEAARGPLGALVIDFASLSTSDQQWFNNWIRQQGFAPVPASAADRRGVISFPCG